MRVHITAELYHICRVTSHVQGLIAELAPQGVAAVQAAIVSEVASTAGDQDGAEEEEEEIKGVAGPQGEHVCTHYFASRAIRR